MATLGMLVDGTLLIQQIGLIENALINLVFYLITLSGYRILSITWIFLIPLSALMSFLRSGWYFRFR